MHNQKRSALSGIVRSRKCESRLTDELIISLRLCVTDDRDEFCLINISIIISIIIIIITACDTNHRADRGRIVGQ